MNSDNIQTSDPHKVLLSLSDKTDLKKSDKCFDLQYLNIYYIWKIVKKIYKNNKFKISAPT